MDTKTHSPAPPAAVDTVEVASSPSAMMLSPTNAIEPTQPAQRRPRVRTAHKLAQLRAQVDAWAAVALTLPLVNDADEIWDAFLDDDLKRVRSHLRQLTLVTKVRQQLAAENALLATLLDEHRLASDAIHRVLTRSQVVDDWPLRVQRWKALARIHFRPWTQPQCTAELDAVRRAIHRIENGNHMPASGLSVMGWIDSACHQWDAAQVHFSLEKTFRAFDLDHFVRSVGHIFHDTELYTSIVHGGRARASIDILQQLSPHVAVVMYHEQYPGVDYSVHMLSLNGTFESEDKSVLTQFYRPIESPDLMRAFVGPKDTWMSNFHWARYHIPTTIGAKRASCDYRVAIHGTMYGDNLTLLRYWRFRVLETLIRIERVAARRELLEF